MLNNSTAFKIGTAYSCHIFNQITTGQTDIPMDWLLWLTTQKKGKHEILSVLRAFRSYIGLQLIPYSSLNTSLLQYLSSCV